MKKKIIVIILVLLLVLTTVMVLGLYKKPTVLKEQKIVMASKTVDQKMSNYEASRRGIELKDYEFHTTKIYTMDINSNNKKQIFTDEKLPVFIMWPSGGDTTNVLGIVKSSPIKGSIIAKMAEKSSYKAYDTPGALYELSVDGKNKYRKIFDLEKPITDFILSPDSGMVAYIEYNYSDNLTILRVRNIANGRVLYEINLDKFKNNFLSGLHWKFDNKNILINVEADYNHIPPGEVCSEAGVYNINIETGNLNRLTSKLADELTMISLDIPGFSQPNISGRYLPILSPDRKLVAYQRYNGYNTKDTIGLFNLDNNQDNLIYTNTEDSTLSIIGWIYK